MRDAGVRPDLGDLGAPTLIALTKADKLSKQRDIDIDYRVIKGANHFFTGKLDDLNEIVSDYVARPRPAAAKKREKQASAAR